MSTKKQKAELAIQYPAVRAWVLRHIKWNGYNEPMDLWNIEIPTNFISGVGSEKVYEYLWQAKHLYNEKGARALMDALLDRIS